MNIEKLDFETIEHEKVPYTVISTFVIQKITDHLAGFIWVYLQSLPPSWKVNKYHIMEHFDISDRTYQRRMSFLCKSNLISYENSRSENGTLGNFILKVLNGTKFIQINHTAKNGVVDTTPPKMAVWEKPQKITQVIDNAHSAKKPHSGDLAVLYKDNKDLTNTIKNIKQEVYKNSSMQLFDVLGCNPFNISETMLSDWLSIRKSSRKIVTATAWDRLNKELQRCVELKIDPHEAFETMVANGWNSLKADWLQPKNKKSHFDNNSTSWANNIEQDMF